MVFESAFLVTISYVIACAIVTGSPLRSRNAVIAYVVGVAVFIPFPLLVALFVLPGLAWLALFGLAVPAALVEGLGFRASFVRGYRLARADFVHMLGGLATLALVVFLTQTVLFFVLREYAENTRVAAATLASLVVSPLLFLGTALLYVDQKARLGSGGDRGKERHAQVPHAHDADREGVQTLHANPGRLREVNKDVEEMGAQVLHQWGALGEYDFVNVVGHLTTSRSRRSRSRWERAEALSSSRCR